MLAIAPRVDADTAERLLRTRSDVIRGLLFGRTRVRRLERVYMPFYCIRFEATSVRGPGEIAASVDAYNQSFAIFQREADLEDLELDGETFPPKVDEVTAVESGRKNLMRSILRTRGQRGKPVIGKPMGVTLFHHPFWVAYYERGRGNLDIRVLDAATGEKPGSLIRLAILDAFVNAARTTSNESA